MSMASFERGLVWRIRHQLERPSFKLKELMEWSTAELKPQDETEEVHYITADRVYVTIKKQAAVKKKKV